ncbi:hypothetical protein BDW69DRAFT_109438 [Aspergillus filifer]
MLIGKATRMLTLLPGPSRQGRFVNTSHGCVFLDNVISALLDKASSLSIEEQMTIGRVNKDEVQEWDIWTLSRTTAPKGTIRALSTLNRIQVQSHLLSRIVYHNANIDRANVIVSDAQHENAANNRDSSNSRYTYSNATFSCFTSHICICDSYDHSPFQVIG